MITLYWIISAVVLTISAGCIGCIVRSSFLGIFLDSRGRFSLSQFQISLWTIVILSLLSGVFIARVIDPKSRSTALNITIPNELLIVMGISVGSAGSATAVKAGKDIRNVPIIGKNQPSFSQVFLVEEGTGPEVVDIMKFQNFWLTLIIITAYVVAVLAYIDTFSSPSELTSLPGFDDTWLILLGISHSGYIAGKIPDRAEAQK